jgi:hypothetical protein
MILFIGILCLAATAVAGFKAKVIKSQKPERFQAHAMISGVTFAADLLLDGKDQRDFFYRELTPCNIIPLRLAIFNDSAAEMQLRLDGIRLTGPDGKELLLTDPETVARAALQGFAVSSGIEPGPAQIVHTTGVGNPRTDKTDPNYDPRLDPADPRNRGYDRGYGTFRPGVGVVLNPAGGKYNAISGQLIAKDFVDKAHSADPIPPSMVRDRFLYFVIDNRPASIKGFELRISQGSGIIRAVSLKF